VAAVGATGLAVSNALVGGSVKTAVRQGARRELAEGAVQARRHADGLIGASDDFDLDFTALAVKPKGSDYQIATREVRSEVKAGTYQRGSLQGRFGVDQGVYQKVEQVGVQRGKECARYGITSCAIANGLDTSRADVEVAAGRAMREDAEASMRVLNEQLSWARRNGRPTAEYESALVKARSKLIEAEVGMTSERGLDFSEIGATLREMKTPHRSLGMDPEALAALRRGETPPAVVQYQRKIDAELVKGNAVMAALYTGSSGAHAQHAVTILGKGRDASGRIVYEIYDSNVGRVAQVPVEAVKPYGAVVVGRS
jgi:hypothetical protein